jgi:hypothetical protein
MLNFGPQYNSVERQWKLEEVIRSLRDVGAFLHGLG